MPNRNRRHDVSLLLVLAVGLLSIQGCPTVGDNLIDQNLPGLTSTPSATANPANVVSATISEPTAETSITSGEQGEVPFEVTIPANTLIKGTKVTVECGLNPGSRIPADRLQDDTVKDRTLAFYFYLGTALKNGITKANFGIPDAIQAPADTTATLLYYNSSTKGWEEAATFLSKGTYFELSGGAIAKKGTYCLYLDAATTPTPSASPSQAPTVASITLSPASVNEPLAPPPSSGQGIYLSTLTLTPTVKLSDNTTNNSNVTWSLTPTGHGVTVSNGVVTVGSAVTIPNGEEYLTVTVTASKGGKTASIQIPVINSGMLDATITE
ncbi:MAG: hypothetical protein ACM3YO_03230 [Bacteroidota bacterium]